MFGEWGRLRGLHSFTMPLQYFAAVGDPGEPRARCARLVTFEQKNRNRCARQWAECDEGVDQARMAQRLVDPPVRSMTARRMGLAPVE
jgi:hypothetical protein